MGKKVDLSEVQTLANDLKNTVNEITSALDGIRTSVEQVQQMDSFSGKTAKNAKNYFNDLHGSLIDSLQEVYDDLETNLTDHLDSFEANVDSSSTAIVESDYLNEIEEDLGLEYDKLSSHHQSVKSTINDVQDISAASSPELYSAQQSKNDAEEVLVELDSDLSSFTKKGKSKVSSTQEFLQTIEKTIDTAGTTEQGTTRFTDYESGTAKKAVLTLSRKLDSISDTKTVVTGLTSSVAIFKAAQNKGLSVSKYTKNGKVMYRINAKEQALKKLGVEPDPYAKDAIKKSKKHQKAPLNYYDKKTGTQVWSRTGKEVIEKHPAMRAWNDKAMLKDKAKIIAKETGRGAVSGIKGSFDIKGSAKGMKNAAQGSKNAGKGVKVAAKNIKDNPKNIKNIKNIKDAATKGAKDIAKNMKGATKALGPLGAGLSYYGNYHDAKADGLSGKEAHSQAVTDTAVDVSVGSAVQAGFTAAGTALIPIPGVGTAVGTGIGMGVNWALNQGIGKSGKSVMDRTKGAVRKVKGWFS